MLVAYLHELAQAPLPVTITDPNAVRNVELLVAALLINATRHAVDTYSAPHSFTVHEITHLGWAILSK